MLPGNLITTFSVSGRGMCNVGTQQAILLEGLCCQTFPAPAKTTAETAQTDLMRYLLAVSEKSLGFAKTPFSSLSNWEIDAYALAVMRKLKD